MVELGIFPRWIPVLHSSALVSTVVTGLEFCISWFPGASSDMEILETTFQSPTLLDFFKRKLCVISLVCWVDWVAKSTKPLARVSIYPTPILKLLVNSKFRLFFLDC